MRRSCNGADRAGGKLKFEHLPAQLETMCEQAAKRELNYQEFLNQVLMTEWQARRLKNVERGLRLAGFLYVKTLETVRLQLSASHRPQADSRAGWSCLRRTRRKSNPAWTAR